MPPPEIEAKKLMVVAEAQTVVALELIETKGLTVVITVTLMAHRQVPIVIHSIQPL